LVIKLGFSLHFSPQNSMTSSWVFESDSWDWVLERPHPQQTNRLFRSPFPFKSPQTNSCQNELG